MGGSAGRALPWSWHAAPPRLQIMNAAGGESRRCRKPRSKMRDALMGHGAVRISPRLVRWNGPEPALDEGASACREILLVKLSRGGQRAPDRIWLDGREGSEGLVYFFYIVPYHPLFQFYLRYAYRYRKVTEM